MATVFTDVGEAQVSDFINGDGAAPTDYFIEWGSGTTGAVKGDTDIENYSTELRVTGTNTQPSVDKNQWVGTITAAGTISVSEVGLFDDPAAGNMFIRKDFTPIPLEASDQIEFTVTLELT